MPNGKKRFPYLSAALFLSMTCYAKEENIKIEFDDAHSICRPGEREHLDIPRTAWNHRLSQAELLSKFKKIDRVDFKNWAAMSEQQRELRQRHVKIPPGNLTACVKTKLMESDQIWSYLRYRSNMPGFDGTSAWLKKHRGNEGVHFSAEEGWLVVRDGKVVLRYVNGLTHGGG